MFLSPAQVIISWFRGILALGLLVGGIWLIVKWYEALPEARTITRVNPDSETADLEKSGQREPDEVVERQSIPPVERIVSWRPGWDRHTAEFFFALTFLVWATSGRSLLRLFHSLASSNAFPRQVPGQPFVISRPDGTEIYCETWGSGDGPVVVLTHGWSLSREEWAYLQKDWGDNLRVVVWDLPGLGKSKLSSKRRFTLEEMARDLLAVVERAGKGPVILMGHSIGGMTILTFCKLFPNLLGSRVSKLVLIHTTYINPLCTMNYSALFVALQKPVIEPLLYLQIWLSPLVRVLNIMSYWNGTLHSSLNRNGFGIRGSFSDLEFLARYYLVDSPSVLARGALAMLAYDATPALPKISIPVLVISGDRDPITSHEASQKIASDISAAKLLTLSPAKHFGLIEHHAEFSLHTREFCA